MMLGRRDDTILNMTGTSSDEVQADIRIIIKLAPHLSSLHYVDIDTSHFSGNEAPMSQVFALTLDEPLVDPRLSHKDPRWTEILPTVELGPNSRHIFELGQVASQGHWSAVMVRMIPDGGMVCLMLDGTDNRLVSEHTAPQFLLR